MIFALDIGTRKIAGLLVDMDEDGKMIVHDVVLREHEHRAMLDGQIHDVEKVAKAVKIVKEELENRNNVKLDKVAVALAGRFLKTYFGEATMNIADLGELTSDIITKIELEAVANTMENVEPNMYCVGYSVIRYELDGMWFKKLEGLRGDNVTIKVVATFLPSHVVEAMLSVLKKVNLTITHLTLEPIAAVNVTVPEDLRILNIALVDVGAGTSDIAISKDGTIVAYGMVPIAGDELTEAITKTFLLDFSTAEYVKRNLEKNEVLRVKNILDKEKEIRVSDVIKAIEPVVEMMTKKVAEEIIELNGEKPQVVMVVGGGAKVPTYTQFLAKHLGIDEEYVSLKMAKNLDFIDRTGQIIGSEFVTPLGIGYTALTKTGSVFEHVTVNEERIQLIGFKGSYTVWEVLAQAGKDIHSLLGKPGKSVVVEVNGEPVVIKGKMPKPAPVKVNGREATLRDVVKHADVIEVGEAADGEDANPMLYEIIKPIRLRSLESDEIIEYYPRVKVNGNDIIQNIPLNDGDVIKYESVKVKEIREFLAQDLIKIEYSVNGAYREFTAGEVKIFKDELELRDENSVELGEELKYALVLNYPKVKDLPEMEKISVVIKINGQPTVLTKEGVIVLVNDQLVSPEYEIRDGDKIKTQIPDEQGFIVADILKLFNFDIKKVKSYNLLKNGEKVGFTEPLESGDEIIFEFETIEDMEEVD
ncbi:MAG: cell division protein FtsA [Fervidobacterium sp.]|uniref:Cell division protein FtsA n=1 Tax=Fervidobacterium gondwanense DSM 13020 TaxID=1121883 RepID=A0A1M7TIW3_FERGO|nr:cell division protein FtsA [Fervidobacterium gondwanense]UXF00761.1 cell division protein FtsA [Fervidobacterium riparium]SHN70558.1 cell division protein FtsA [Fervidobacterium gondwanense DSM 13020]